MARVCCHVKLDPVTRVLPRRSILILLALVLVLVLDLFIRHYNTTRRLRWAYE